jgi:hypothetical protein
MKKTATGLMLGSLACLVAGCSGGGGSDGSSSSGSSAIELPPAEISSANAPIIAGAVTQAAVEGSDVGEFAGFAGGGAIVGGSADQVFAKIGSVQSNQFESLRERVLTGELQAAIPPETTDCAVSGTVTVSGDVANPLTLTGGDTFTLVFDACDDGAGIVDGTYAMRITSFSGDLLSGSFSMSIAVTLTDFELTADGQTVSINGDVSVSMTSSASPTQTVTMTSSSLSVSDGTDSHTLTNYSAVQSIDQLTYAYTLEVSGALSSSAFDGTVTFATSVELVGDGTGYAFSGEIRVTGAQSATIEIIVLDSDLVRLEIDLDGDGVIDEIVDTTWAELLASG